MSTKKRMTAAEFEAVRPFVKIAAQRVEAARAVMVDGATMIAVGKTYGWTKQAVDNAVRVVWSAYESYNQSKEVTARIEAAQLSDVASETVDADLPTHGNSRHASIDACELPRNKVL